MNETKEKLFKFWDSNGEYYKMAEKGKIENPEDFKEVALWVQTQSIKPCGKWIKVKCKKCSSTFYGDINRLNLVTRGHYKLQHGGVSDET